MLAGTNGQLEIDDTILRISRKGLGAFLAFGFKGEKEIPISEISSVYLKRANPFRGYFTVTYPGGKETAGGLYGAMYSENVVVFKWKDHKQAEQIRDIILSIREEKKADSRPRRSSEKPRRSSER